MGAGVLRANMRKSPTVSSARKALLYNSEFRFLFVPDAQSVARLALLAGSDDTYDDGSGALMFLLAERRSIFRCTVPFFDVLTLSSLDGKRAHSAPQVFMAFVSATLALQHPPGTFWQRAGSVIAS
eukprot:3530609-Pleurochrysis_carterae.AAC.1